MGRKSQQCTTPDVKRKRTKPKKYTPELLTKYSGSKKIQEKMSRAKKSSIPKFTTKEVKVKGKKLRPKKPADDLTTESSDDESSSPMTIDEKVMADKFDDDQPRSFRKLDSGFCKNRISMPARTTSSSASENNITQVITCGSDEDQSPEDLGFSFDEKRKTSKSFKPGDSSTHLNQHYSMEKQLPSRTITSSTPEHNITQNTMEMSDGEHTLEDDQLVVTDPRSGTSGIYKESGQPVTSNTNAKKNSSGQLESHEQRVLLNDDLDSSLVASTYTGKMKDLGDTGYRCKEAIYYSATSISEKKETILARRLLEGVIKPEFIAISTLSGRSARAQGAERQKKKVQILHPGAVAAIKAFARSWAVKYKKDGWTTQDEHFVNQSLRTRIVEIKNDREVQEDE